MNTIMIVFLGLLAVTLSALAVIFLRNRIVFLMGLRNIPRRMAQTVLIVVGLMLSTVIITAAFTTGDTVDYSITSEAYDLFGHADLLLDGEVGVRDGAGDESSNISAEEYQRFLQEIDAAESPDIDGAAGMLLEPVPVISQETNLSEPNVVFAGVDASRMEPFPDIIDKDSGEVLDLAELANGEVFLNESAADELNARPGDRLTTYVEGQPHELTVRAVVLDRGVTGAVNLGNPEGMVATLETVQEAIGTDEVTFVVVSVTGGVRDTLDGIPGAQTVVEQVILEDNLRIEVSDTKADLVSDAEEAANFLTTFFLLLGLFSIGAGTLLIVMIFVMLAAERKPEMGMARAVGMKRRHLIEMFLAEGVAYNLMAAVVGVVLGIVVAFGLATAASAIFSTFGFTFTPHVTARTVAISASMGFVLTFFTVSFSSWRISSLNIVAAIRDIEEQATKRMGWKGITLWVIGLIFGVLMIFSGLSSNQAFPFMLGVTLLTMGTVVFLTYFGFPARPAYTSMSLFLLVVWGLAAGNRLDAITGRLDGDIEMFFLSGVSMVAASTFLIVYNSDVLLAFLTRVGGAFGSILPSIRTAVAYPMANRFRTGMTLAMISLVVFALTTMSAMNLNYDKLFLTDESRGGWDVQVFENPNNPIPSVQAAIEPANPEVASGIAAEGAILVAGESDSSTEVTQNAAAGFEDYPVLGLTNDFLDHATVPLDKIANGYADEEAVWQAIRTDPTVAVIDAFSLEGGFGPTEFSLDGIPTDADTYDPPTVIVRDSTTGVSRGVEIIGVLSFGASGSFTGIFMGEESWTDIFGEAEYRLHYIALENPDDSSSAADAIEAALVTSGAQADSLKEIAEENSALSRNFLYLMQAFMGLGLVVGIAAVGVISFRTVVERRQQIGMLRAIGYKRNQVALSFLLESGYVTVLGVLSGTFLGLWLAWFLVTSDDFPGEGNTFYIPWFQIILIATLTIVASILMTLIPSRQAASVPTAEALRYE